MAGRISKEKLIHSFVVIVDTREQHPYLFPGCIKAALPCGDYTVGYYFGNKLMTYEKLIVIERKTLDELFSIATAERSRFEEELLKLSRITYRYVIVECNFTDLSNPPMVTTVDPQVVAGSIVSWMVKYNVPFIFAGNRVNARAMVYKIFSFFIKYHVLGLKTIDIDREAKRLAEEI